MNELEKKLNEVKGKLKTSNIISIADVTLMVIGAVILIVGQVLAKKTNPAGNPLFFIGLGMMISVIAIQLTDVVIFRKEINEYYRLQKEIRKLKK